MKEPTNKSASVLAKAIAKELRAGQASNSKKLGQLRTDNRRLRAEPKEVSRELRRLQATKETAALRPFKRQRSVRGGLLVVELRSTLTGEAKVGPEYRVTPAAKQRMESAVTQTIQDDLAALGETI